MNETENFLPVPSAARPCTSSEAGSELPDPSITQAVEHYRALLQSGTRPNREAFLAHYPELAPALAECLDALDFLHHAAPQLQESAAEHRNLALATALPPEVSLGDFRLLREVGRGGMGIVYEAEQLSLRRRVALKVLPFAAALDARQLQRFKNEAQAAAALHHRHIVPIYQVGCADGVHYYAMQFIEGQTLAAMIRQLRQLAGHDLHAPTSAGVGVDLAPGPRVTEVVAPTPSPGAALSTEKSTHNPAFFRTVVQLGIQAAEALEHAHQVGVIHRDIKPANLLLDGGGNLWITDFGLAKFHTDQLTLTGDVVGTLRYMSPEQALGKQSAVDQRTDVYALGVTLYELLTLEPAVTGENRQDILRRILSEEPRTLRQVHQAIPRELETIVLKAMSKEPGERYATAQGLAEDLRRYLEDRPILAKRPTWGQRFSKWRRRHRPLVRAAVVVLVMALVCGGVLAWQAHLWTLAALEREHLWTLAALESEKTLRAERTQALAKSQAEQQQTQLALDAEQQMRYVHTISLSHRECLAGNFVRADDLLSECPPRLRDWEWYYLKRLSRFDLRILCKQANPVNGVTFSPDGQLLATAADKTVRVWDARTGQELSRFLGHPRNVHQVAFSPAGRYLASTSSYYVSTLEPERISELRSWDLTTGRELYLLRGQPTYKTNLAFSPDGKRLVAGSEPSGVVKVWDAVNGKFVGEYRGHTRVVTNVAFSPDGQWFAAAALDHSIKIWEAHTAKELLTLRGHVDKIRAITFSPDSQRLASAGVDDQVRIWDAFTGEEVRTYREHLAYFLSVAFGPNGRTLTASGLDAVYVWDIATGRQRRVLRENMSSLRSVVLSPDGRRMAAAKGNAVHLWDMRPEHALHVLGGNLNANAKLAFSADGKRAASVTPDCAVKVWDTTTGQELLTLHPDLVANLTSNFLEIAFRADGKCLATLRHASGNATPKGGDPVELVFWDLANGKAMHVLRLTKVAALHLRLDPEGKRLLVGDKFGTVLGFDAWTGQELFRFTVQGARVNCLRFYEDGKRFAVGYSNHTIRIVDATTGTAVATMRGHTGGVLGVAHHQRTNMLASASTDGTIKMWDATSGQLLRTIPGRTGTVTSVAISVSGQRLVSTEKKGVKIWDAVSGQELLNLTDHAASVRIAVFNADGRLLGALGQSGRQLGENRPLPTELLLWDAALPGAGTNPVRRQAVDVWWHETQARACEAGKRWRGVLWHLDRLVDAQPLNGLFRLRRAYAHAELGQWDNARDDSAQALKLEASVEELEVVPFRLAWLRLHFGDTAGYQQICAAVLKRFGHAENPYPAYLVVRVCTMGAVAVKDQEHLVKLGRRAVAAGPAQARYLHVLGAALYRAGQFKEAVTYLREAADKGSSWEGQIQNRLFLAMSLHQHGQTIEARQEYDRALQWLAKATKGLPKQALSIPGLHPHTFLAFRVLRPEAEAVLNASPEPSPESKK